jgi:uncharacterized protein
MEALKTVVSKDLIKAMKEKDTVRKGVLTLIKAGIQNAEIKKRSALTSDEELAVVYTELKQTKDALAEAEAINREDIVSNEKRKVEIIMEYLPKQMTAEEIKAELVKVGVTKDMPVGKAIGLAMASLKGKAEGSLISNTVKDFLK